MELNDFITKNKNSIISLLLVCFIVFSISSSGNGLLNQQSLFQEQSSFSSFPLILHSGGSCTPDSGYDNCYEACNYKWKPAEVCAKNQYTNIYDINGNSERNLVRKAIIKAKCGGIGDTHKLYIAYGKWDSWSDFWDYMDCEETSCSGGTKINNGEITLKTNSEGYVRLPVIVCHGYDENSGWTAWKSAGYGWVTTDYSTYYQVVDCKSNSDCGSNQYCENNECNDIECLPTATKCVDNDYYACENYKWKNKGIIINKCGIECLSDYSCLEDGYTGNEYCSGYNVRQNYRDYSCVSYKCEYEDTEKDKGIIINKCGVNCLVNTDCGLEGFVGDKFCSGKDIGQRYKTYSCINYNCISTVEIKVVEECKIRCVDSICVLKEIGENCSSSEECNTGNCLEETCSDSSWECLTDVSCEEGYYCNENICEEQTIIIKIQRFFINIVDWFRNFFS